MNKSIIERIFPHSPGSRLPQYEYDLPPLSSRSSASSPRIVLQDSTTSSPSRTREVSSVSPRQQSQYLASSLVRHDDPFLPVERASKSLERTLQNLLDAQSEGLSVGIGSGEADDTSSVGSPTPTPSVATPASRRGSGLKTIPIRQPKPKKVTLRGARKGLGKSMKEFADLKRYELKLIEREVVARDEALTQVSDLGNQRTMLEDKIHTIRDEETSVGLRSEVHKVEQEIREMENALFELKARHRHLTARLREEDSTKESRLSSYNESVKLNETQTRHFLRQPPILQSLGPDFDRGMYALKPERRTLQMAQEQWTTEVEVLNLRKADVENEKAALEQGSFLWRDVVRRINDFERELKAQTRDLSQSQLQSYSGDPVLAKMGLETSMQAILTKLATLISELKRDLQAAEHKNWNLLVCAIGAELVALEQARDLLTEAVGVANGEARSPRRGGGNGSGDLIEENATDDDENQHAQHRDLLDDDLSAAGVVNGSGTAQSKSRSRSPGEGSNQSLEDTLREFGAGVVLAEYKGKRNAGSPESGGGEEDRLKLLERDPELESTDDSLADEHLPSQTPFSASKAGTAISTATTKGKATASTVREPMSESEDDDPGPEFLLSHT